MLTNRQKFSEFHDISKEQYEVPVQQGYVRPKHLLVGDYFSIYQNYGNGVTRFNGPGTWLYSTDGPMHFEAKKMDFNSNWTNTLTLNGRVMILSNSSSESLTSDENVEGALMYSPSQHRLRYKVPHTWFNVAYTGEHQPHTIKTPASNTDAGFMQRYLYFDANRLYIKHSDGIIRYVNLTAL